MESNYPLFQNQSLAQLILNLKNHIEIYELPSGEKINIDLVNNYLSIRAVNLESSRHLTNFPKLKDSEPSSSLNLRIESLMGKIARDSILEIQEFLDIEGSMEEEKAYWNITLSAWNGRFGPYKKTEIIGSTFQDTFLVTYALIEFDKGVTIAEFRQNEQKKFFIGHPSFLLPRYYRLIPQSKSEFLVYNHILQTSSKIVFNKQGLTIQSQDKEVFAKKIFYNNYVIPK